ncbi:cytochrome C oxidase subunit IV family protein [Alkalimarinus coralli]|uniref:cytochrome C oxidase subunit IV family protein n=1 Tax=Alkalimarinus coralli TaxID=2935863 RepID=UPI00202B656F|nr:cytochrome C oxidase subunit IV family protein [Alkalimarinus coralli]
MNKLSSLTTNGRHLDVYWLLLIAMTLISAAIAEKAEPSLLITIVIAAMIVIKARLVIDHFMELKSASPYIYHLMNAYFYLFPLMAVLVWLFPETLAEWTRLGP